MVSETIFMDTIFREYLFTIAKDKEEKLKEAIIQGYDFVGINWRFENNNILIDYTFAKGTLPNADKFKEIYALNQYRKLYNSIRINDRNLF